MPVVAETHSGAAVALDEATWFGTHDHAVAEEAAGRSMAALVGRIIGAKPFPISARRLADLTRLDVVRIEPVIQVLETDPGLSTRLLRLVNSAGYALRQRCTSVRHAATLVGTDRLHQIATTAAVLDLFDSKGPIAAQIIEHSTVVGAFCRYLGAHLALPVDDLFTAGFLHDIGKLMLMETEGDQYVELLSRCASQPDCIHHLERKLYGFDHASLAAHVLSAWNIPDPVPKIVGWHHEPAHAYNVSSLMASLVQTVRLSDAIVCAMRQDTDRAALKDLAKHEAASYLEISEPQLAAMWDELRVLFDECHQQCLGENAPALDPRSLRPRQPIALAIEPVPGERTSERAHDLPKQFPCVECGCPTFGNTCPACGGYVCPDHQVGANEWCTICSRDYESEKKSLPIPLRAKWAFGALGAAIVLSGFLGMLSAGGAGALRAGFGTLLLGLLTGLLYVIGKTWLVRTNFVRSRPNRFVAEPQLNDGGTQSLAPTMNSDSEDSATSRSVNWLKANIHLVEPLKEITIREISGAQPSSDAEMHLPPDASVAQVVRVEAPAPDVAPISVDPVRVQLQSESLVTLPAPARNDAPGAAEARTHDGEPASTRERSPRDTLTEQDAALLMAIASPHSGGQAEPKEQPAVTPNKAQTSLETASVRKTDPGLFSMPFVTFRDADVVTERSREAAASAQWDDSCSQPLVSRLVPTVPNELRPADDSQSSEVIAVVQPIVTINPDSGSSSNSAAVALESEPRANQIRELVNDVELVNDAMKEPEQRSPSHHPLAALGIHSQPPRPTSDENASEAPFARATSPAAEPDTTLETTDSDEHPSGPEAGDTGGGHISGATNTKAVVTDELLENLANQYTSRFDDDFESHVRELAAQRVAQMIAERFMAAFDVSSLIKEPLRDSTDDSAAHEPKATPKARKRKRST